MSASTTFAPRLASAEAIPKPMPEAPPVMTATVPLTFISETQHASVAVAMVARPAEQLLGHPGALEVEARVVNVGHADAAVHLDHLVGDEVGEVAGLGLGE